MNVILLGAPGAGKGTQGELLAERHGLRRISTGDLLREAVRNGTRLGLEAKRYMDAGELVPDDIILGLAREVLGASKENSAGEGGFLLDGFPRTRAQAEGLDRLLAELGLRLDAVIVIDVPNEILIKRLSGRRTCTRCGAVFNIYFDPPRTPGTCSVCGGPLEQRSDDEPDTIRRRLEVYQAQTEPLVQYYVDSGAVVRRIDGDRPVRDVFEDLTKALES